MFTLTISDKPVAVTNADADEARDLFMSDAFKHDLQRLESDGAPLWDGFATLAVRPATEEELVAFDDADVAENGSSNRKDDDAPMIIFLVDVTEPDEPEEE
jgi:hypothetical protein